MINCPQCGEANPDRFRVCGMCGAQLTVQASPREVRKTVTIVFTDLKGSTAIGEQLDTESVRDALTLYFSEMQAVLRRHGGIVEKYIGDAIMAVFGLPAVHEDDALRAVRAALEMQDRLNSLNAELDQRWGVRLENRTGVNTGEVVAGDPSTGQRLVSGDTVNTAARLEAAAPVGGVLLGALTYQLVKHAVSAESVEPLELKGKANRVPAYRLLGISDQPEKDRRFSSPMVGRTDELGLIQRALGATRRDRAGRLVTVIGAAGVGKSRLINEFLAQLDRSTVTMRGRCLPYGDGITFWPLIEAIRVAAGIDEQLPTAEALERLGTLCSGRRDVVDRLAPILGLADVPYPLEETFWAVRGLLQALGSGEPVILVFDDIHWAEPTLLDLIEQVGTATDVPVLLVCSARADLLDERPGWCQVDERSARIDLRPLSDADSAAVIAGVPGGAALPSPLVERIGRAAEGNPLFVEQMVSMLVDRGIVRPRADGGWEVTAEVEAVSVPPTVAALIEARLDRLPADDRSVLQEGSVIGVVFYPRAVESMSPPELRSLVADAVEGMIRRRLIRPEATTFMDEPSVRFDHALIQDAAYRSLLKRERANLHERFADWLETRAVDRSTEADEIVGYHLEQAARHLAELGPIDERGRTLARRGSEHLARAGRRASSRGDYPAAANLLGRAASLLDPGDRQRVELQLDLAEADAALGEFDTSEAVAGEALAAARGLGDDLLLANAELVLLFLRYTVDPEGRSAEVIRTAEALIGPLEEAADDAGLVRAWRLLAWVHGTACQYGAAEAAVEEAVRHARSAQDRRAETRNLMSLALSALYGPRPVSGAIAITHRTAAEVSGDRRAEGVVLCALSHLQAMAGSFDEARRSYQAARAVLEELGGKVMAATVALDSGRVELLADDSEAAERELRHDYEVLEAMGERYTLSTIAGLLAEAVLRQGRRAEAIELTSIAEDAAAEDDVESQSLWRRVRARALTRDGSTDEALALAQAAYQLVAETDAPVLKAACLMDLAQVCADRDPARAVAALRDAVLLLDAKGDLVDAQTARGLLERLESREPGGGAVAGT